MSLRLAEAFLRAASPDGHPPVRTLEELRGHMAAEHGLGGIAGMFSQRVLLHMHETDHSGHQDDWDGSGDSSRAPGFIAARSTRT